MDLLVLLFVYVRNVTYVYNCTAGKYNCTAGNGNVWSNFFLFSLSRDVPGPECKLIIVYPNLFYHSVFIKNAHIIHLFSFSNIGLLLFL
jgi:hypothetical protein